MFFQAGWGGGEEGEASEEEEEEEGVNPTDLSALLEELMNW